MEDPCKNCYDRQWYARRMDIHFWGEDCPYVCEEYERYKKELDDEKEVRNPEMWIKANPNLGITVSYEMHAQDVETKEKDEDRKEWRA